MKRFTKSLIIVAAMGSCVLVTAQTGRAPAMSPPPTDQAQQRAEQEMDAQMQRRQMETAAPTSTFDQLDTQHLGYLTLADAKKDRWLSKHFRQCDTSGDGQVSRVEYAS